MKVTKHFIRGQTYNTKDMLGYDIMHRLKEEVGYHYRVGNSDFYIHGKATNGHFKIEKIQAEGLKGCLEEVILELDCCCQGRKYG